MLILDRIQPDRIGDTHTVNIWTGCGQHIHGRADTPARAMLHAAALACAAEAEAECECRVPPAEVAA